MRAQRRNQALVDSWFELLPGGQRETAAFVHEAILQAVAHPELLVRSGNLYYGQSGEFILALAPHRTHVHLQVLRGGEPSNAFPALVRSGKGLMWRFKLGEPVDVAGVRRLATVLFSTVPPPPPS